MAIHQRKDFAKLCGIAPRELSIYIKRGKVILSGKKVDDSIAENAEFLESRKNGVYKIEIKEKKFTPAELKRQEKKQERNDKHLELNTRQKELDIEKSEEEIMLLKIKKEKQEGIVIPTSFVRDLFALHFKSITVSFQQGADNLILEISKKKKLTKEETAKLRKKLIDIINMAVNDSAANSEKNVDNLVKQYTEKLGVGQRR